MIHASERVGDFSSVRFARLFSLCSHAPGDPQPAAIVRTCTQKGFRLFPLIFRNTGRSKQRPDVLKIFCILFFAPESRLPVLPAESCGIGRVPLPAARTDQKDIRPRLPAGSKTPVPRAKPGKASLLLRIRYRIIVKKVLQDPAHAKDHFIRIKRPRKAQGLHHL